MSNPDKIIRSAPVSMEECGAAATVDIIADRWSWLIIREALYGVSRFDDIRADIGIPRSVLTGRLRNLTQEGILLARPYKDPGARTRTEYVLTEAGQELAPIIIAMMQWGDRHLRDGKSSLKILDRQTGQDVKIGLVTSEAQTVPLARIAMEVV